MMPKSSKRRTLSPQFKFKVAIEAIKAIRRINEIAAEHQVHPAQVTAWTKELLGGAQNWLSLRAPR